jgi:hypothetical protein
MPTALAQGTLSVDDLKRGFQGAYKNEEVAVRGWVARERRVASQSFKGYYLRDRFGSLILIRTTKPLPEITSEIEVTGVALQDADSGDIYLAETKRESPGPEGSSATPPSPQDQQAREAAAREQERLARETRGREEAARRQQEESQRNKILIGIGVAVVLLIGVAIVLVRRRQPAQVIDQAAQSSTPMGAPPFENYAQRINEDEYKTKRTVDDYKTVKVYKTAKVLPGTLAVMQNQQETDVVHLTDQTGRGEVEIGRDSPDTTDGIRIKDKTNTLSRRQARLVYSAGNREFKLMNLAGDSSNPTIINGRQMNQNEAIALKDGDVLLMGNVELKFKQR